MEYLQLRPSKTSTSLSTWSLPSFVLVSTAFSSLCKTRSPPRPLSKAPSPTFGTVKYLHSTKNPRRLSVPGSSRGQAVCSPLGSPTRPDRSNNVSRMTSSTGRSRGSSRRPKRSGRSTSLWRASYGLSKISKSTFSARVSRTQGYRAWPSAVSALLRA